MACEPEGLGCWAARSKDAAPANRLSSVRCERLPTGAAVGYSAPPRHVLTTLATQDPAWRAKEVLLARFLASNGCSRRSSTAHASSLCLMAQEPSEWLTANLISAARRPSCAVGSFSTPEALGKPAALLASLLFDPLRSVCWASYDATSFVPVPPPPRARKT